MKKVESQKTTSTSLKKVDAKKPTKTGLKKDFSTSTKELEHADSKAAMKKSASSSAFSLLTSLFKSCTNSLRFPTRKKSPQSSASASSADKNAVSSPVIAQARNEMIALLNDLNSTQLCVSSFAPKRHSIKLMMIHMGHYLKLKEHP